MLTTFLCGTALLPVAAMAQCQTSQSCSALGYTATSCPNGGVKCPFGTGWWCKPDGSGGDGGSEGDDCKFTIYDDCFISVLSYPSTTGGKYMANISCYIYEAQCSSVINEHCVGISNKTMVGSQNAIETTSGAVESTVQTAAQLIIKRYDGKVIAGSCSTGD